MLYTLRLSSSKCSLFHNANLFGSCITHILYTGCAKIKKVIPAQRVKHQAMSSKLCTGYFVYSSRLLHDFRVNPVAAVPLNNMGTDF